MPQLASRVRLPEIHPRLFIGNVSESKRMLSKEHDDSPSSPTRGVCIASERTCSACVEHPETCIAISGFKDSRSMDESKFFEGVGEAADAIHAQLSNGHSTLVNCYAGINRSASGIVAYAVKYRGMTPEAAIDHIRSRNAEARNLPALTNDTFERYLVNGASKLGVGDVQAAKSHIRRLELEGGGKKKLGMRRRLNEIILSKRL